MECLLPLLPLPLLLTRVRSARLGPLGSRAWPLLLLLTRIWSARALLSACIWSAKYYYYYYHYHDHYYYYYYYYHSHAYGVHTPY